MVLPQNHFVVSAAELVGIRTNNTVKPHDSSSSKKYAFTGDSAGLSRTVTVFTGRGVGHFAAHQLHAYAHFLLLLCLHTLVPGRVAVAAPGPEYIATDTEQCYYPACSLCAGGISP